MLWWFVETTLVAGLLAGAAALLGRLRTISPTARHLLWLVVLIKLIMPPVIRSPWALTGASGLLARNAKRHGRGPGLQGSDRAVPAEAENHGIERGPCELTCVGLGHEGSQCSDRRQFS